MTEACPIPTGDQRTYGDIQSRVEDALLAKVSAALKNAYETASAEIRTHGLEMPPPTYKYFVSKLHQNLYCMLCNADPKTFEGGDAKIAAAVIQNCQNVAQHCWGADIERNASRR